MGAPTGREHADADLVAEATAAASVEDLAQVLRQLRRRQARQAKDSPWTLRELAARTGWARSAIGDYLSGQTLPPTDRFDVLVGLFEATPVERGVLATARDRVEEARRTRPPNPTNGPAPTAEPDQRPAVAGPPAGATFASAATVATSGGETPVPRQLPARVPGFAGRSAEVAALDELLASDALLAVLSGTAGVGKTALAVHWAHRVAARFPDGQLFVNLRGFEPAGPPTTPEDALRGFLDRLGVAPGRIPAHRDALAEVYRTAVAGRRMLIVLDNAASVEQVRPLLPGSAGSLALVTSRYRLTALTVVDGARPLPLDLLTPDEAGDLLAGRLGAGRMSAEPAAARVLIDACARLPLALSIVAARAASNPTFSLASLGAELTASNGLDVLDGGDPATDLRTVFSWSYERLGSAAARLFRLLGLHAGPDIAAPAVASLAGADARTTLSELTGANLLTESAPGRYTVHDLLRSYAAELAGTVDPAERDAARLRIFEHYLHTAYAASRIVAVHRDDVTIDPPQPGVRPEPILDHRQAMAWLATERAALVATVRQAADAGFATHAWKLAWSLFYFLHLRGRWKDAFAVQQAALAAVRKTGDLAAEAAVHRDLAHAYTRLNRFAEAYDHLGQAQVIYTDLGDTEGLAWVHHRFGWAADNRGEHAEAVLHADEAQHLFRQAGNLRAQAQALNCEAWYHSQLGANGQALVKCQQALDLYRALDDGIGQAYALDSMGCAHFQLGAHAQAATCYAQSLEFFRSLGEPYHTAQALTHVGDVRQAMGDADAAGVAWREALSIFDGLGLAGADGIRARLGP